MAGREPGTWRGQAVRGGYVTSGTAEVGGEKSRGNLFTKQQLRDRAAAVVFAFDHGLVKRPE